MNKTIYKFERNGSTDYVIFKNPFEFFSLLTTTSYGGVSKDYFFTPTGKTKQDLINFLEGGNNGNI